MTNSLASTHKEAIAIQLVRFVHLIPNTPFNIWFSEERYEIEPTTPTALSHQMTLSLYFRLFDTAFSLLSTGSYGLGDTERLSAAVDIVELVKNKLTGNE